MKTLNYELIKERSMKLASSKRYQTKTKDVFDTLSDFINIFVDAAATGYTSSNAIEITLAGEISRDLKNLKPFIYKTENLLLKDLADTYVFEGLSKNILKILEEQGVEITEDMELFVQFTILEKVREKIHDNVEHAVLVKSNHINNDTEV